MIAELEVELDTSWPWFYFIGLNLWTCRSFLPTLLIRKLNVRFTLLIGLIIFVSGFYFLYETNTITRYFLGTALLG